MGRLHMYLYSNPERSLLETLILAYCNAQSPPWKLSDQAAASTITAYLGYDIVVILVCPFWFGSRPPRAFLVSKVMLIQSTRISVLGIPGEADETRTFERHYSNTYGRRCESCSAPCVVGMEATPPDYHIVRWRWPKL